MDKFKRLLLIGLFGVAGGCVNQGELSGATGTACGPGPDAGLPMCGTPAGYSVVMTDCGGRRADGLRCATCTWQARSADVEIQDAAVINVEPGCTALGEDGGMVLCVFDCLVCR